MLQIASKLTDLMSRPFCVIVWSMLGTFDCYVTSENCLVGYFSDFTVSIFSTKTLKIRNAPKSFLVP